MISSRPTRTRFSPYASELLPYPAAVGLGLLAGYSILMSPHLVKLLLLLPALLFAVTVSPERLFIGWLYCAPLVQGAASGGNHGHLFFKYLFFVPPLILAARMMLGGWGHAHLWLVDVLPALYLIYILIRVTAAPSEFSGANTSFRGIYGGVGIGIIAYYFTAFAQTSDRFPIAVARALLWGGVVVAFFALVDTATGWNPWHNTIGGIGQVRRVSSTFEGPVPLGTYLGAAVSFAVAILVWNGPQRLRLPAILVTALSIPALFFTYTRGPILGVAVVTVTMALLANRARWPSLLVFATVALLLFGAWGRISSSTIYHERLGITSTVTQREEIQHESIQLFRDKPIFGWGYNSFDKARLALPNRNVAIAQETSHDSYLTVLVELGVVGLILMVLPWVVIAWRSVLASWRGLAQPWIIGGCVGAAVSYAIGALTYDARFFSFTTVLPFIVLGVARKCLARAGGTSRWSSSTADS